MTLVTTEELPATPPAFATTACSNVRQNVERLDLPQCRRGPRQGQTVHADVDAIAVPPAGTQAEVLGDATLVHALLDAAAAWRSAVARASVDWRIDVTPWPVRARATCHFAHVPADPAGPPQTQGSKAHPAAGLDTLDWLLLHFTAHIAGVLVQPDDSPTPTPTRLMLDFMRTVSSTLEAAAAMDLMASAGGSTQSFGGGQMLVLASQRGTRQRLRGAMQGQDLSIDHVSTVDDTRQDCRDGALPLLVVASAIHRDALAMLLAEPGRAAPGAVLVEVLPAGQDGDPSAAGGSPATRLGIDALRHTQLPVLVVTRGPASTA